MCGVVEEFSFLFSVVEVRIVLSLHPPNKLTWNKSEWSV